MGDAGFKAKCEARFVELAKKGHTIILVSHQANYIQAFCQRALLMDHGRIAQMGTGAEIAQAYNQAMASRAS